MLALQHSRGTICSSEWKIKALFPGSQRQRWIQTFRTPNGSVSSVTRDSIFLPRGRHRDPTLPELAIQVRLLGNHCHLTEHPSSQGRSSSREDKHPLVCIPPQMLQWHVLLKEVCGVTTGSLHMGTTPAKAPQTKWVSCVVIQMHNWWSSKKEDSESLWWGTRRREFCKRPYAKIQLEHRASKSPQ